MTAANTDPSRRAGWLALSALCALAAYLAVFTQFAPYDDEGTLLTALRAYVAGGDLYEEVYTSYGPAYFQIFGTFFGASGIEITTNVSRLVVIGVWVGSSLLLGLAVQRLTGHPSLGWAGMAIAFLTLGLLEREPMHPVGLIVVSASLALYLMTRPLLRPAATGAAVGALVAVLMLTKVNVGAFALAALVLTASALSPTLRDRRLLRPVAFAFLLMPAFLTVGRLNEEPVRDFVFLEAASYLAAVIVLVRGHRPPPSAEMQRWFIGAALGWLVASMVLLAAIVVRGSSVDGTLEGVLLEALRQPDIFSRLLEIPISTAVWGVAAVVAAALAVGPYGRSLSPRFSGSVRLGAGLAIWLGIGSIWPIPGGLPVPLLLAWLALLPPKDHPDTAEWSLIRTAIPLLAIAGTLQVFPVAGTQVASASVLFIPVGAICIRDGLIELRTAAGGRFAPDLSLLARNCAAGLAVLFAYLGIVRPGLADFATHSTTEPLPFAGAGLLHLPPPQRDELVSIVELIETSDCTSLVGLPSSGSLYLWSGLAPPAPTLPGAWMTQLNDERQSQVVAASKASARPCAYRNESMLDFLLGDSPPPPAPLVRYIESEFEVVETAGAYEFMLPVAPQPDDAAP